MVASAFLLRGRLRRNRRSRAMEKDVAFTPWNPRSRGLTTPPVLVGCGGDSAKQRAQVAGVMPFNADQVPTIGEPMVLRFKHLPQSFEALL
jgi:hypothetical protein